MKLLSFLFGRKKKDSASCTEPVLALPEPKAFPSSTVSHDAPSDLPRLEDVLGQLEAKQKAPLTSPSLKAGPDANKSYAHLNYPPRLPKKENTESAVERAKVLPAAEPTPPATPRVESAPPLTPRQSSSSTLSSPALLEPTPGAAPRRPARVQWHRDSFPMEVVGESNNQAALIAICGPYTPDGCDLEVEALIELEPRNPHDPNAVIVMIQGRKVGYLPREQAARVGGQMREEGLNAVACAARIRGGWYVNEWDAGQYGVRLAIPTRLWIDFGIGTMPPRTGRSVTRPVAAKTGPLLGHWVVVTGARQDSSIAEEIAAAAAKIMAGVTKQTTLLVVAEGYPFTDKTRRSAAYRKAEELIDKGSSIRIVSLDEVRAMIAAG